MTGVMRLVRSMAWLYWCFIWLQHSSLWRKGHLMEEFQLPYILAYQPHPQINRSRKFSHIPWIKGNSRTSRKSINLFTGDDPARSINHKILIFTNKCNERQFYCSKPKKSSSEGSSSISTVDRRRCHLHLLHLCHGCRRERVCENFVPLGILRV